MPRRLSKSSTTPDPTSLLPPSLTDPTRPLPKLLVFDLDYTLWPFWVDTHVSPPLKPTPGRAGTSATDKLGEDFAFYADVPQILQLLPHATGSNSSSSSSSSAADDAPNKLGVASRTGSSSSAADDAPKLGVASRTGAPPLARDLLKMLRVPPLREGDEPRRAIDVFDAGLEMYPGGKVRHLEALQRRTGIRFEDMLFFDDERRNADTERLGVTMCLVRDGLSWPEVERGVEEWRRRRRRRAGGELTGV